MVRNARVFLLEPGDQITLAADEIGHLELTVSRVDGVAIVYCTDPQDNDVRLELVNTGYEREDGYEEED